MVKPDAAYMEYGAEINLHLDAAMKQDPNNPRPEYLKGQGLKYTPEQFGGGCATAAAGAAGFMDKYNAFKPASELHPNWGKQRVELLLGECK